VSINSNLIVVTKKSVADVSEWPNIGAIALETLSVVIDSSDRYLHAKNFRERIENHFGLPTKYLVITHYHADHIGGLDAFADSTIICSEQTAKRVRSKALVPFTDQYIIQDRNQIVEIYHSGGHTAGSSFVYSPKDRTIFTGDLIITDRFPPYGADNTCDPELWVRALERMKDFKPTKIVPGHGSILNGWKELDKHLFCLKSLRKSIKEAIHANIKPSKIEITDFIGEFSKKWARVTVPRWYSFYKLKEELQKVLDGFKTKSYTQIKEILARMTLRDLGIIADYLGIEIDGKKDNRIELIINHIS
jgi:glyoxylase-like metal-dependent hydrolase (beta-lactamase superfamily II)